MIEPIRFFCFLDSFKKKQITKSHILQKQKHFNYIPYVLWEECITENHDQETDQKYGKPSRIKEVSHIKLLPSLTLGPNGQGNLVFLKYQSNPEVAVH